MENAGQIATSFNAGVLKEPRGFLKPIQFVLSIFAFATTTCFSSSSTFKVDCSTNGTNFKTVSFSYSYPFDQEDVCMDSSVCSATTDKFCLLSGSKSSAEFYVFVGVNVMLYCLAALVLYIFFDEFYRRNNRIIVGDFVVSVVLTVLWLISLAWAAGLADVKEYTDPAEGGIFDNKLYPDCMPAKDKCHVLNMGNYGSLNASVIFGFLNMLVWIGNLWFLYKETPWFKVQSKPPAGTPGQSPGAAIVY